LIVGAVRFTRIGIRNYTIIGIRVYGILSQQIYLRNTLLSSGLVFSFSNSTTQGINMGV